MPAIPGLLAFRSPEGRRLTVWGTYDLGKPRVRILLDGARRAGLEVTECHGDVWSGVEDKSTVSGLRRRLGFALRWLTRQPGLVWRFLRSPPADAVLVPYLGHLDVLVLWPWARIRRRPVVLDAFLSLYDTAVLDRRLLRAGSLGARLLHWIEGLSYRAADLVFFDTDAQARAAEERFRLAPGSVGTVWVGAEDRFLHTQGLAEETSAPVSGETQRPIVALFYGQFIPLHGIDTIVEAAALLEEGGGGVRWRLVGQGQESERIDRRLAELGLGTVERIPWIPYEELPAEIQRADICLGIFGGSEKAGRVIPNKVFQILAVGRPLVTADTPGIREILSPGPWVELVPAADPRALARAVASLARRCQDPAADRRRLKDLPRVGAEEVGAQLARLLFRDDGDPGRKDL